MPSLSFARMSVYHHAITDAAYETFKMQKMQLDMQLCHSASLNTPVCLKLAGAAVPCKEAYRSERHTATHNTLLKEAPHLHTCQSSMLSFRQ